MKSYEEFIESATGQVKEKLAYFDDDKTRGKVYQDKIVGILSGTHIILSNSCKLQDSKKQNVISNILKDIPLIDNELYGFLRTQREHYRSPEYRKENNYPGKTLSLEDYIADDTILSTIEDDSKKENRIKYINKKLYPEYQIARAQLYKDWNGRLKNNLFSDSKIQQFISQRVDEYNTHNIKLLEQSIWETDIEIDSLQKLLQRKDLKKEHRKQITIELENLYAEKDYTDKQLQKLGENMENKIYIQAQKRKFKEKFVELLKHYIASSGNHADENLRKKYIELFLYNDIQEYINISKGKEYDFKLNNITQENINITKNKLLEVFDVYKQKDHKKVKRKQQREKKTGQFNLSFG